MFVLGIGTGRCGTQTLSTFLGLQKINTRHESLLMPWEFNQQQADALIKHLKDAVTIDYPDVAEVNFSLLNYSEYLLKHLSPLRIIVLKRLKKDTIRSWMKNQPYVNMWTDENHESFKRGDYLKHSELSNSFPKYDLGKEEALASFWDDYYQQAELLAAKYPDSIKLFDMYDLFSSEEEQEQLLSFTGVDKAKQFTRAITKKIDEKAIVQIKDSIKILKDLFEKESLDLSDFKAEFYSSPRQLLKFLVLGVSVNTRIEKMPDLILENQEICKDFFGDLKFLDSFKNFIENLRILIAFLNEDQASYSYPTQMSLKVRELCIKSIA